MAQVGGNILTLIISTVFFILIIFTVGRLLAQIARADFYNPIAQSMVKITNPMLLPLRKIIPGFGGIDNAAIFLAAILQLAMVCLILLVNGSSIVAPVNLLILSLFAVLGTVMTIVKWGIIIVAIASFISPGGYNPVLGFIAQITDPFVAPIRKLMPSAGGLDFSPMVLILLIIILQDMLLSPIAVQMDFRAQYFLGL